MADHYLARLNADGTAAGLFRFGDAPDPRPENAVDLTAEQYQDWRNNFTARRWQDGAVVAFVPPPAPPQPYAVPKIMVVNRLAEAGLLRTAYVGLKLEAPIAELSDDEFHLRERWNAAAEVMNTDQDVRNFLAAIHADVDAILAVP